MAQLAPLQESESTYVDLDITQARREIKRVIRSAREADRALAQLEERLGTFAGRLRRFGIGLEVEE